MKSKEILIIEFGEGFIKTCQVSCAQSKRVITALEAEDVPGALSPEAIEKGFAKLGQSKFDEIIISLPRSFFLMRFLELPSSDIQEIGRMLPFQLAKIILCPLDEILYDFSVAEVKEDFSRIIVFIIQKKNISHLFEFIETKNITPSNITISSCGVNNWLILQEKFLKNSIEYPIALIDIDKQNADFLIVNKGNIMFSRSFSYFRHERFLEGIYQSLMIFHREFGKEKFSGAIFTGIRKEEILKETILGESVFIDCLEHASLDKHIETAKGAEFSFASLVGLSLDKGFKRLDFSPDFLKEKKGSLRKKKRYFESGIIGLEIIIIILIFFLRYTFMQFWYLGFLNSKLKGMKMEVEELDTVARRLKILDTEFLVRPSFSQMIYVVTSSLPSEMQLTLLDFQEDSTVSLKGYADDIGSVFQVVKSLNESGIFRAVKIKYASQVKRASRTKVEFYIQGKIRL
jgi:hypothetical protein